MNTPVKEGVLALTDKEKQVLRLIVRGHDAKSVACSLGLSVHTINERLRDARRKLAVSSSREAARILLKNEGDEFGWPAPELSGNIEIGEDAARPREDQGFAPIEGAAPANRRPWILIGVILMTLTLALMLLTALPDRAQTPPAAPSIAAETMDAEVVDTARQWLVLLDNALWDESYRATGMAFRKLNTVQAWTAASLAARAPLGGMISRTFVSQENLPAPPAGYDVVKFRTRFTNKAEAIETVTLELEDSRWRVVGVTVG